jgi:hypothetical protein
MGILKKAKLKKQKQSKYNYLSFTNPTNFDSLPAQDHHPSDKQSLWTSEKVSLLLTFIFFYIIFYNYVLYDILTSLSEFYGTIFYDSLDSIVRLLHRDRGNNIFYYKSTSTLFDLVTKNPSIYPPQAVTCLSLLEIFQD